MITSTTNQKVKRIVQLNKRAASRNKEDVFVTEGIKMFLETPEEDLEEVYLSENFFSLSFGKFFLFIGRGKRAGKICPGKDGGLWL